jgi:hypothetical protein
MKAIRFLPLVALVFAGCASMESAQRANAERLLCASGFKVIPATTVERQQSLAALPPFTIVRKLKGDDVHYAYADPVQNLLFTEIRSATPNTSSSFCSNKSPISTCRRPR